MLAWLTDLLLLLFIPGWGGFAGAGRVNCLGRWTSTLPSGRRG